MDPTDALYRVSQVLLRIDIGVTYLTLAVLVNAVVVLFAAYKLSQSCGRDRYRW